MADQLIYPLIRGVRHGFANIKLKFALPVGSKKIEMFCKSINYGRTRSRGIVRGNHPDPIAKTIGENEYKANVEIAHAECMLLIKEIGPGYGDLLFDTYVSYGCDGFDTTTDEILGCSIDDHDVSNSQGPDPLMRKLELGPLKILMAGIEDLLVPMISPP